MEIEVVIPCVQYSDFLSITLPVTRNLFESITVVTSPEDHRTGIIARKNNVGLLQTNKWFKSGASFNKAAALNEHLDMLKAAKRDCWVLLLDADILFAEGIVADLAYLDKNGLYSIRRRMCNTYTQWNAYLKGTVSWEDFPLYSPRIIGGRVWGRCPTSNHAALCGYLQLWHLRGEQGLHTLPEFRNASGYDVKFALSFPEKSRKYLERREVLHLGPPKTNWKGRMSPFWNHGQFPLKQISG